MKTLFLILSVFITSVSVSFAGSGWTPQISGTTAFLCGVSFVDANTGTVVGDGGTILRTTTGGE